MAICWYKYVLGIWDVFVTLKKALKWFHQMHIFFGCGPSSNCTVVHMMAKKIRKFGATLIYMKWLHHLVYIKYF
ncbi:hypothetical protein HanIR_Chr07g0300101 [Helianthus annuus]|nr:hypothetical protein HanIR_Chr07g0300101 [Helianthus annuus]